MRKVSAMAIVFLGVVGVSAAPRPHARSAQAPAQSRASEGGVVADIDAKRARYADVAKQIWDFAEVGY